MGGLTLLGQTLYWLYAGDWIPFTIVEIGLWLALPPDHGFSLPEMLPALEALRELGPNTTYGDFLNWLLAPQSWTGLHQLVDGMGLGVILILVGAFFAALGVVTD